MLIYTLFNNKGGVSKTTTAFHLGWKLVDKGHRVLLVDADPQCNLTQLILTPRIKDAEAENIVEYLEGRNVYDALDPAYNSRPKQLEAVECVEVNGRPGLFLLPGSTRLAEYETALGIAQQLSETLNPMRNVPGAFRHLITITARKYNIDYVLIDVSPSLGSLNQNITTSSDRLIIPLNPDVFSVQAIASLSRILPAWVGWAEKASNIQSLMDADYPFVRSDLKFCGTIIQRYRQRNGGPTAAFGKYFEQLRDAVTGTLRPALSGSHLLFSEKTYLEQGMGGDCTLAEIPDFNTLIASSQDVGKPVFALSEKDTGNTGVVFDTQQRTVRNVDEMYSALADKIVGLS